MQIGNSVVGIRPDTERTGRRLRALLAAYCADDSHAEVRDNFSVRSPRLAGLRRTHALYLGGELISRASSFDRIAQLLVGHLSGLAARPSGCTRVPGRLVVRGEDAVVVGAAWAAPVVPADGGTEELAIWRPMVEAPRGAVRVLEYLPQVAWSGAGVQSPADLRPQAFRLRGLVLPAGPFGNPEIVKFWLRSEGHLDEWGLLLSRLDHEGVIIAATDPADVQDAVVALLA